MSLQDLLAQLPEEFRELLEGEDPVFAADMAKEFLEASELERKDFMAFVTSDGPRKARELVLEHEDGTPTSWSLKKQFEES